MKLIELHILQSFPVSCLKRALRELARDEYPAVRLGGSRSRLIIEPRPSAPPGPLPPAPSGRVPTSWLQEKTPPILRLRRHRECWTSPRPVGPRPYSPTRLPPAARVGPGDPTAAGRRPGTSARSPAARRPSSPAS